MEEQSDLAFKELKNLFHSLKKSHDDKIDKKSQESGDPNIETKKTDLQFETLIARLDEILSASSSGDIHFIKLIAMKSSLLYEQAKLLLSMDELDASQTMLEAALGLVKAHREHRQITFLYLRIINHLAYLLSKKGEFETSKQLLEDVLESEPQNNMLVYSTDELFSTQEIDQTQATSKLNKLIANNLQMLGWIYGRLGQPDLHAVKQHMALERQKMADDWNPINWACQCCRLAALFLTRLHWVSARYHLLAAGAVLDQLERELITHPDIARAQAELARGWINYGLHLFSNSKMQVSERKYPGNFVNPVGGEAVEEIDQLKFSDLEIRTEGIPACLIQTTEQARALFLHTHTWLKRARLYYTLRDFPIHYVNAVLDLSELYRLLAFFEPDLDSQYNVQKKRADALETLSTVLRDVRPQCYIAVSVELLRELAEVQLEMMGINLRRLHMANNIPEDENSLQRKISAISNIQMKLEDVSDMLGHHVNYKQESLEAESDTSQVGDDKCSESQEEGITNS